jgi:hypothetical protein
MTMGKVQRLLVVLRRGWYVRFAHKGVVQFSSTSAIDPRCYGPGDFDWEAESCILDGRDGNHRNVFSALEGCGGGRL